MATITIDQNIDQGSTFLSGPITVVGTDLTSATVTGAMKRNYGSSAVTPFTVSVITPVSGIFKIGLSSTSTATLVPGKYVYDVKYQIGSTITKAVQGNIYVLPSVS